METIKNIVIFIVFAWLCLIVCYTLFGIAKALYEKRKEQQAVKNAPKYKVLRISEVHTQTTDWVLKPIVFENSLYKLSYQALYFEATLSRNQRVKAELEQGFVSFYLVKVEVTQRGQSPFTFVFWMLKNEDPAKLAAYSQHSRACTLLPIV